jgi:hypothetical protein
MRGGYRAASRLAPPVEPDPIVSEPYTIRRMELTYATAELYVRALWWALIGMPISGVLVIAFLPQPIMKYLGAVMILWPITIPGRAAVITSDQRKIYGRPTVARYLDGAFFLDPEGGTPTRIPSDWIHRVFRRGDLYVLRGMRAKIVLIRASGFSVDDQARIEADLRQQGKFR